MRITLKAGVASTNPSQPRNRGLTRTLLYPQVESRQEMGYISNYYAGNQYCGTHQNAVDDRCAGIVRPRGEFLLRPPVRNGMYDDFARTARTPFI